MVTGGPFPGVKRFMPEADQSLSHSSLVQKYVELYLHSLIRLHGVVLC